MLVDVHGCPAFAYTAGRVFDAAAPTVVFVHGAGSDHSVWALQSRYFAYHGRNVLAVDLPGHGLSGGEARTSVEKIADWLTALLDALSIEQATLIGHSLGALAVLDATARHRERVTRVALLGPAAPMLVADALLDAARNNEHAAYELIKSWSFSPGHQLGGGEQPGVWMGGQLLRLIERSRPDALYRDLVACRDYQNGVDAARRVRCPALALVGARDLMAPLSNATLLIDALADKRVVTLTGCGHSLMAEAPGAVLDALRGFLI